MFRISRKSDLSVASELMVLQSSTLGVLNVAFLFSAAKQITSESCALHFGSRENVPLVCDKFNTQRTRSIGKKDQRLYCIVRIILALYPTLISAHLQQLNEKTVLYA